MRPQWWLQCLVVVGLAWLPVPAVFAEVKPHPLISNGMVLQRGMKAPIWGTAGKDEKVTVRFQGQEVSTTANDGKWQVQLDDLKEGGPYEMTISGANTIQLKNVLVGEVWVCSGQSNMEWPVSLTVDSDKTIANSKNPMIRLFTVEKRPASAPKADVPVHNALGKWHECDPATVGGFTAVGYFFGRDLQKALKVPIGLIHTSWGGTPAESWTSRGALEAEPSLKYMADNQARALEQYPKALEKYVADLTKYKEAVDKAVAAGEDLPPAPQPPVNPAKNAWGASTLYNGMIASLVPYAIRGAIWYQGESNAGRAHEYRTLLPAMIKDWRAAWKQGDFPFLVVQLAPFMKIETQPAESAWAELRDAQLYTTKTVPNTAEAVITDVGEEYDIHPRKKEPVGARLALAARALAYGEKIEYSGPVYKDMKVEGDKVVLSFDHVGGGLVAKGGEITGFTIAGEDRKFVNAEAQIEGDKVVVRSANVAHPVAVRFGWANYPVVNFWNKDGLPATPFRTDEFPLTTEPQKSSGASRTR
jgi:sialate O-acetylesterase